MTENPPDLNALLQRAYDETFAAWSEPGFQDAYADAVTDLVLTGTTTFKGTTYEAVYKDGNIEGVKIRE